MHYLRQKIKSWKIDTKERENFYEMGEKVGTIDF